MFWSEKWGHSLEAKKTTSQCRYQPFPFVPSNAKTKKTKKEQMNLETSISNHQHLTLGYLFECHHILHSSFCFIFIFAILAMHEGAHFTVINACEIQFTCCSPDGDTGAYHHPCAWLMRVTAVIFKTCWSFWVWLRFVCLFLGRQGKQEGADHPPSSGAIWYSRVEDVGRILPLFSFG